ncbi:MAG: hypothetical protein OZ921_18320 [Sorangiineae bacterium]|nr:hypothetical protein [Polyangiaceae bacterium]MEB2324476.1 hypothetical protein [Sorangiineae bacterium]
MHMRRWLAAGASSVVLLAGLARAQPVPSLDLRDFHPPTDPEGSLYLEPSRTPGPGAWNAGAWFSYEHRLIVIRDDAGNTVAVPVENQLSLDYLLGLGIGDRLAVGLQLPTVLYQSGDAATAIGAGALPATALGDATFGAKATLVPPGELGGFGLAALGRVSAPIGDRASYASDGTPVGELRLLGELRLIVLDVRASAGARVRGAERTYVGEDFGHSLPWAAGVTLHPRALGLDDQGRWAWTLETHGAVAITPRFASGAQSPAMVGASARYGVGDVALTAGVEAPLDSAVGVPLVRGVLGVGWAPRFYDQDGDGIADDLDECAELAEDRDGFEDRDGCPDFDNDDDGVPDPDDQCPTVPEDEDGFEDDDGCPDPDNDRDGVPDGEDACPDEAGPKSANPKRNGCPVKDSDGDGVMDDVDKCPNQPEDRDGFEDTDGCPDPDNDEDGVPDGEDACPNVRGWRFSDPALNGCPSPDQDGDTFDDAVDECPDRPEDFNGFEDDDGCPDSDRAGAARPLVEVEVKGPERSIRFRQPPRFTVKGGAVELAPASGPTLRAMAQVLNQHRSWTMMVGVRPTAATAEAEQEALTKSLTLIIALESYTRRSEAAESVGWAAVKDVPGAAASGIGVEISTPPPGLLRLPTPVPRPVAPLPPPPPPKPGQ